MMNNHISADVATFCELTHANVSTAEFYLTANNNLLNDAITAFFDEGGHDADAPDAVPDAPANAPDATDPDGLLDYWRSESRWQGSSSESTLLPEYFSAWRSIIIKPEFMRDSTMRRALRSLNSSFGGSSSGWSTHDQDETLKQVFQKAWPSTKSIFSTKKKKYVSFHGIAGERSRESAFEACRYFFSALSWERSLCLQALKLLVQKEDATGLQIIVGLMVRGADECNARKRASFYDIINRVQLSADGSDDSVPSNLSIPPHESARENLKQSLSEYIDKTKDKAFKSTFLEPTKMYFHKIRDYTMEGDVEVHGANVYLALLASTVGIALNRDPYMKEEEVKGVVQFVDANLVKGDHDKKKKEGCWSHENIGKSWESIASNKYKSPSAGYLTRNTFCFHSYSHFPVADIGLKASDRQLSSKSDREKFAVYLEQFCSYFHQSSILEKMFAYLTVELAEDRKTKHELKLVYDKLIDLEAKEENVLPEDVRYFCYDEEKDFAFNTENALKLFSYIGVC